MTGDSASISKFGFLLKSLLELFADRRIDPLDCWHHGRERNVRTKFDPSTLRSAIMLGTWQFRLVYNTAFILSLYLTVRLTRPGLERTLARPIARGFGPPCTLWQAWKLFCSFFWERVLLIGVGAACAWRLWLGHWQPVDLLIAAVVAAFFPFQEYFTHRFLLHQHPWMPFGSATANRSSRQVLVHRVHHRDPWHMQRAINPPVAIVWYAYGLPFLFFPWLPLPQAMTAVASFWVVLLIYEWIHLLIHTSHVPRNWLYKRIWTNHRLHHFKNEHFWFNVSTYGVDLLLATGPPLDEVPTSATCLTPARCGRKRAANRRDQPRRLPGSCGASLVADVPAAETPVAVLPISELPQTAPVTSPPADYYEHVV